MRSSLLFVFFVLSHYPGFGQWSGSYGNEWIDYTQPYVRIGVKEKGVQRLKVALLPANFRNQNPAFFQIWHRGKEIALLSADSENILFYGEPNDGASDSLLYRPVTARINPYVSLFSEEGAYFLTYGKNAGKRATTLSVTQGGATRTVQNKKELLVFKDQFAGGAFATGTDVILSNSYYEAGKTWTGPSVAGGMSASASVKDTIFQRSIHAKNRIKGAKGHAELEFVVTGLLSGSHNVIVSVGANNNVLREVATIPFVGYDSRKARITLKDSDFSDKDSLKVRFMSKTTNKADWFGVTYISLAYKQEMNMKGTGSEVFSFSGSDGEGKGMLIRDIPQNIKNVLDVSDFYDVKKIPVTPVNGSINLIFNSNEKSAIEILVSTRENIEIAAGSIKEVSFKPVYSASDKKVNTASGAINPSAFDYLMIVNDTLQRGAISYAKYRSSSAGGGFNTILVNIHDVYNEFNYGEPSPVAIRRFVSYMLKDGIRPGKHNLVLLGHSVTYSLNSRVEMPNEVPTYGDPGADILLVAGLAGANEDQPAIPVGRISAFDEKMLLRYLDKVISYEGRKEDLLWRKSVLHMSGGHSASEIAQLKGILDALVPSVTGSQFAGVVSSRVKVTGNTTPEKIDITREINSGTGLLTYFGHGSQNLTDLDFGSPEDASRGFKNENLYPLMYFNGCGVGNVFTSRRIPGLAGDWMFADKKGSIAIIANSYRSYVSPSVKHLASLYKIMFEDVASNTIGEILIKVAADILNNGPNRYDIANVHQMNLLGDPALKILRFLKPDYIVEEDGVRLYSESPGKTIGNSQKLIAQFPLKNGGKYNSAERINIEGVFLFENGREEKVSKVVDAVSYSDTIKIETSNSGPLSKVLIRINPDESVEEMSYTNNTSELVVDWQVASTESYYPVVPVKDAVNPHVRVQFNKRYIENGAKVSPNPTISVVLEDDRILQLDPAGIEISYRNCSDGDCELKRVSTQDGSLTYRKLDDYSIEFVFQPADMKSGDFELFVNGRDRAGNRLSSPYTIRYVIDDSLALNPIEAIVYPNPASSFAKFKVNYPDSEIISIRCILYDANGVERFNEVYPGTTYEWFLYSSGYSSGIYLYKVFFTDKAGKIVVKTGRLVFY